MMFHGREPDTRMLQTHTAEVLTLRIRLAEVGVRVRGIAWDDESFGSSAGWIAEASTG